MHKCIMLWMVHQRANKAGAQARRFFYMGNMIAAMHQISWFYMARALTSVMAKGVLRAVSHWFYHMRIETRCSGRERARKWITPGVLIFLDKHHRRAVRSHITLDAMSAVSQRRGELFPPTEGEYDVPCSDSDSDSTLSQERSQEVYEQRMWDTASAVRHATSVALLKATERCTLSSVRCLRVWEASPKRRE